MGRPGSWPRAGWTAAVATVAACSGSACSGLLGIPDVTPLPDATAEAAGIEAGEGDAASADVAGDTSADAPAEAQLEVGTDAAPTWDPYSLPGLVLWLDAEQATKDTHSNLVSWPDLSDAGNAGSSADGQAPVVVADVLPGHAVVQFAGTVQSVEVLDAPSLRWGTNDFLVLMVGAYTNVPSNDATLGYGSFYSKQSQVSPYLGVYLTGNDTNVLDSVVRAGVSVVDTVDSLQNGYNDGKPHLFGAYRSGLYLTVLNDRATTQARIAARDVSVPGVSLFIGGVPPYYAEVDGYVAEVIAASGALTSADVDRAKAYLLNKYGL
jgi:hypothetical protein